jgi:flagellar basal body rod protein FlgC
MIKALATANQGMIAAVAQQTQSAQRIANPNHPGEGNLPGEMVKQIETQNSFAANVAVAGTTNEMLGNVIDLFA